MNKQNVTTIAPTTKLPYEEIVIKTQFNQVGFSYTNEEGIYIKTILSVGTNVFKAAIDTKFEIDPGYVLHSTSNNIYNVIYVGTQAPKESNPAYKQILIHKFKNKIKALDVAIADCKALIEELEKYC